MRKMRNVPVLFCGLIYLAQAADRSQLSWPYTVNCKSIIDPVTAKGSTCELPQQEQEDIPFEQCRLVIFCNKKKNPLYSCWIFTPCCHMRKQEERRRLKKALSARCEKNNY